MRKIYTFLAALFITVSAFEMQAQTLLFVDGSASAGANDGTTWDDAFLELADALLYAAGSSVTDIWVAAGTYKPLYPADGASSNDRDNAFVLVPNVNIYGGFTAPLPPGSVPDFGTTGRDGATILSGDIGTVGDNTDNCYHVVISAGIVGTALLDGFTITEGNANDNGVTISVNGEDVYGMAGGGMYNINSSPIITNVTISKNSAEESGGILNYDSWPIITNVIISGNSANNDGGGMVNLDNSSPTITNVIIYRNSANNGGGMVNSSSMAKPILTNVTISGNSANYGGGMVNSSEAEPLIQNSIIWGNTAALDGNNVKNFSTSGFPFYTNSLVEGSGGSGGSWDTSFGTDNGNNIDEDPLFLNPVASDYRLQVGSSRSPAIDAGDDALYTSSILTDLIGNLRFSGTSIDMGAYETPLYSVAVTSAGAGSTGAGYYGEGDTVNIDAGSPPSGEHFVKWTTTSSSITFDDLTDPTTSFLMPAEDVTVVANFAAVSITITTQPAPTTTLVVGHISGDLTVAASVIPSGTPLSYQWYYNTTDSYVGGIVPPGTSNTDTYTFPTTGLPAGTYYVYCVVSATGAVDEYSDFAEVKVIAPAAPTITGPVPMTLAAGYTATSTDAFTLTGAPAPVVTKTSGNAAFSWNNTTQKLDIAAGLTAGIYDVELEASNGISPNDTTTFTLTVTTPNAAPTITGPLSMTLTAGYAATSTNQYTITGTPAPTVTKTSGHTSITWNNTTQKLDIAAGLTAGTYDVGLTASNGTTPNATFKFTLHVTATNIPPSIDGSTTMSLVVGYAATSTGVYTIGGTSPVTVAKTGHSAIIWNGVTQKFEIPAGLAEDTYQAVLTATNGITPSAQLTFTLTVTGSNAAPTITGPTSMTITAGYTATATSQYTIGGSPVPTVEKISGNDKIEWNPITEKLDIATGLAAGTYPVVLRVSNGISPNANLTFTLTVTASDLAPSITGPTSMMLTAGYAAISTSAFTVNGTSPVTVTKNSGNAAITWNNVTQKLDIATGLTAGSYPVVLRASGLGTNANHTFTLTVTTTNVVPTIEGPTSMTLVTGYTATTTDAFTLGGTSPITVTKSSGNTSITWNSDKHCLNIAAGLATGTYPVVLIASNVTATADTTSFTLTVTSSDITLPNINSILPIGTIGTAYNQTLTASGTAPITWSLVSGFLPNGLTMSNAGVITGTPNTTGTFNFIVQATNTTGTNTQAFSITIRSNVSNEAIASAMLKVWTNDGELYVSGLKPGESWRVYNILGNVVYHAIADSDEANVSLPGRGVYIFACGNRTIKVNN